ncbi:MAG TPA: M23 family metallopeptidase, partial [Caulobacteraceae bacterium]
AAGRGRFIWPVRGEIISPFGVKGVGRRNDGVDLRSPQGTVVHAAAAGNVVYAGDQVPGFGNLVLVKHADGWVTAYAHLDRLSVQMRQMVTQGQEVGEVGQTGGVSEPQLHFEVRYAPTPADKARPVDPLLVLPK